MTRAHVAKQRLLTLTWLSIAVGATVGTITTLGSHVRREFVTAAIPPGNSAAATSKRKRQFFKSGTVNMNSEAKRFLPRNGVSN